ncbi:MAG: hypothetical protein JO033_18155 [Acidobacteriaceae bacterium]|nr:hypothetical protein [Acidobacteriaceae bacterium]MBV9503257.1 hypothetical protein [Acidobacteriaceae bacterium]
MNHLLFLLLLTGPALSASAPPGVPRELAVERAQYVSDVRYKLQFTLNQRATSTEGHEELRFRLSHDVRLLLDFRGDVTGDLIVNGKVERVKPENGHIELDPLDLRQGENAVFIDFTTPVASANTAITRYDDKDDGSTYVYTLFVRWTPAWLSRASTSRI